MRSFVVLASLLLVPFATAQQRRICIGAVRDAGGAPIEGASVHAVYTTPGDASFLSDRQTAQTDARGRFRLQLYEGLTYDYWAIGPEREDGSRLVSRLHQGATGGGYFAVTAADVQAARTAELVGFEAWRAHGAATLSVHGSAKDVPGVPLAVGADGRWRLPPLPASYCLLVVADRDGQPLVLGLVDPSAAPKVTLGAPMELAVQGGQVVGDARLYVHMRAPVVWNEGRLWVAPDRFFVRDLGAFRSGQKVVIPKRPAEDPRNYWWRPSMMTVRQHGQTVARVPLPSATLGGEAQQFVADGAAKLHAVGKAWGVDLGAARDEEAFLCVPERGGAPWHAVSGGFVATGKALREGLHLEPHWEACYVYARGTGREALAPVALLRPLGDGERAGKPVPLAAAELTVVDDVGGPGREAWVAFVPIDQKGGGWSSERLWRRADSGGRVRVRLPAGTYGVHATDGRGIGATELQLGDEPVRQQLTLAAMPTLSLRLLDSQDQPIPGSAGYSMVHGSASPPEGLQRQRHSLANSLAYRLCVRLRTDGRGEVVIPIPPGMGTGAKFRFRHPDGGKSEDIVFEPSEELLVVH